MEDEKFEQLRDKVTFISGSSKNAGKTTFLNYLLPRLREQGVFAFTSIGIDGEKKDLLSGNEKPSIETEEGDILVTTELMLSGSSASFQILQVYPWKTVLGKHMLLRTVRRGLVELAGAENNEQLRLMINDIRGNHRIGTVLIDGAVNRITQLAAGDDVSYYYVMKISPENMDSSLDRIRCLFLCDKVPLEPENGWGDSSSFHRGAFTEKNLQAITGEHGTLILEDFTKLFLSYNRAVELTGKRELYFRRKFTMAGIVVNLSNLSESLFGERLKKYGIQSGIIFNPYRAGIKS